MSRSREGRLTYLQQTCCGAAAGIAGKTASAPLDVVKVRTQVGCPSCRQGIFNSFLHIYTREGVRAFWKGNLLNCLRLVPYSTVQLVVFHRLKVSLVDKTGILTPQNALLAGTGAGLAATLCLYPADLVKTRLIVQRTNQRWAHYLGIVDAFRVIVRDEGFLALYGGVGTALLGTIPHTAAMFAIYEMLGQLEDRWKLERSTGFSFFNGCTAAALSQTVSFPFDTIRKKMQAQSRVLPNKGGVDIQFSGMGQAFAETTKYYGFLGLWRGLLANLLKIIPYTGMMLLTYEHSKNFFLWNNGYSLSILTDKPHPLVDQTLQPHEVATMRIVEVDGHSVNAFDTDSFFQSIED